MVELRDDGGIERIVQFVADDGRKREADFVACSDEMSEFVQRLLNFLRWRALQAEDDFVHLLEVLRLEEVQEIDAIDLDGPPDGLRKYGNVWFPVIYGVADLLRQIAEIVVESLLDVFRRTAAQFVEDGRRDEQAVRIVHAEIRQRERRVAEPREAVFDRLFHALRIFGGGERLVHFHDGLDVLQFTRACARLRENGQFRRTDGKLEIDGEAFAALRGAGRLP